MRRRQILEKRAMDEMLAEKEAMKGKCPKCGREIKRGMYMHKKWCNGNIKDSQGN